MTAILLGALFAPLKSTAADEGSVQDPREIEINRRAKRRLYPGGPDENDIRVQVGTPAPSRKMAPSVEEEPSETTAGQTD